MYCSVGFAFDFLGLFDLIKRGFKLLKKF